MMSYQLTALNKLVIRVLIVTYLLWVTPFTNAAPWDSYSTLDISGKNSVDSLRGGQQFEKFTQGTIPIIGACAKDQKLSLDQNFEQPLIALFASVSRGDFNELPLSQVPLLKKGDLVNLQILNLGALKSADNSSYIFLALLDSAGAPPEKSDFVKIPLRAGDDKRQFHVKVTKDDVRPFLLFSPIDKGQSQIVTALTNNRMKLESISTAVSNLSKTTKRYEFFLKSLRVGLENENKSFSDRIAETAQSLGIDISTLPDWKNNAAKWDALPVARRNQLAIEYFIEAIKNSNKLPVGLTAAGVTDIAGSISAEMLQSELNKRNHEQYGQYLSEVIGLYFALADAFGANIIYLPTIKTREEGFTSYLCMNDTLTKTNNPLKIPVFVAPKYSAAPSDLNVSQSNTVQCLQGEGPSALSVNIFPSDRNWIDLGFGNNLNLSVNGFPKIKLDRDNKSFSFLAKFPSIPSAPTGYVDGQLEGSWGFDAVPGGAISIPVSVPSPLWTTSYEHMPDSDLVRIASKNAAVECVKKVTLYQSQNNKTATGVFIGVGEDRKAVFKFTDLAALGFINADATVSIAQGEKGKEEKLTLSITPQQILLTSVSLSAGDSELIAKGKQLNTLHGGFEIISTDAPIPLVRSSIRQLQGDNQEVRLSPSNKDDISRLQAIAEGANLTIQAPVGVTFENTSLTVQPSRPVIKDIIITGNPSFITTDTQFVSRLKLSGMPASLGVDEIMRNKLFVEITSKSHFDGTIGLPEYTEEIKGGEMLYLSRGGPGNDPTLSVTLKASNIKNVVIRGKLMIRVVLANIGSSDWKEVSTSIIEAPQSVTYISNDLKSCFIQGEHLERIKAVGVSPSLNDYHQISEGDISNIKDSKLQAIVIDCAVSNEDIYLKMDGAGPIKLLSLAGK